VWEEISGGLEVMELGKQKIPSRAYVSAFNFRGTDQQKKVGQLSGGERNRVHLAKMLKSGGNLLLLDEPTNDLDVETLELLEERLVEFAGTLLVVSHDRAFLDNVVTSTLVFEGAGRVQEYVGGYTDAMRQRQAGATAAPKPSDTGARPLSLPAKAPPAAGSRTRSGRLSYAEQRELDALPGRIEALEAEQSTLTARASDPDLYRGDPAEQSRVHARLRELAAELESAYARWDALESRKAASADG
jgi:ATP-binding cassette subfamily F protein uup